MTTTATRPVRSVVVSGQLDEPVSRWLWLFKWLLALPHFLVLALLWPVLLLTTVVAGVAILLTGRYPRGLFELNAGVLRWTWRVQYYCYGALGTDRYPPFTLRDVPDYPARLLVPYPERLSRGLVLVKWWLLALPHYLVVALLVGGGWSFGAAGPDAGGPQVPGLIGLLVLIAGLTLAFSGRYPRPLFDLVMGLDRWVLRVAAYAALLTDVYPPFRLDAGGQEASAQHVEVGQRTGGGTPPAPAAGRSRTTRGGTAAVVAGALLLLPSLGLLTGGAAALWADRTQRDAAGYVTADGAALSTTTAALVTQPLDLHLQGPDPLWIDDVLGDVRLRVTSEQPLFLGVGPAADVERYLAGVEHDELRQVRSQDEVSYTRSTGTRAAEPPAQQSFWSTSTSGTGTLTAVTSPAGGRWTAVVMSPDGAAAGIDITADVGLSAPALPFVAAGLLGAGALLAIAGAVLLAVGARRVAGLPS